ncbi:hypothetical protein I6F40_02245 [Pseudoalteromonas sp. SWXJ133]|uniref:GTP pyrophosphokinase n=1 Tax=unclassified Pseudoalteromonas TaxID=194690 RepID=UPI00140A53D5|nr:MULTISPECIES: hypothetical protein [unclassified Pseudoalteromonas]MBH0019200.1 hypothetical protein [Pseudoalteromonas sp. SWXJ133]
MENKLVDWYIKNEPIYKRLSKKVESLLSEVFEINNTPYHLVSSRTKTIDSVRHKGKNDKYTDPIKEIQDFSGVRIITYVEDEISVICQLIEENFAIDPANSSNKSDALGIDKVGYKSVHYVASLKTDRMKLPEYKQFQDKVFEIQIRTILQHAWAEIEHDRNYKFSGKLPDDISRRFKIVAGVLEMADREFNNISQEIDIISENTKEATNSGNLDIPITSVSMSQFLQNVFSEKLSEGYTFNADHEAEGINELELFGISMLDNFSRIFTEDVKELYFLMIDGEYISEIGVIRISMILADYSKYFEVAYPNTYITFGLDEETEEVKAIFKRNNVDWDDINARFGVSLHH